MKYVNCIYESIFTTQQKICQMYDLHTVNIACGKLIKCYDILGVVVFDFKQAGNLSVGFLRQITAYLYIDTLVTSYRHKGDYKNFCVYRK